MNPFSKGFQSGRRSKIGEMATPGFNEAPFAAMANRSNIVAQGKAAFMPKERRNQIDQIIADAADEGEEQLKQALQDTYTIKDAESKREAIGAVLGTVAADVARDGMRNIWWFINAPQALTQIAAKQGIASAAGKTVQPLISNDASRFAATLPAVLAVSLGMGQFGRAPGFKAVIPSEDDPRETDDAVMEAASRYFLGRSGRLLPYDEFVKERPDVSPQEYRAYKQYLFGNQGVLKATDEGILGPEVAFMGKSIPVTTAIAPAVAGLIGTAAGARAGKQRFAAELMSRKPLTVERRNQIDDAVTGEILKQGVLAAGATGVAGQVLESIRRQMGSGEAE